MTSPNHAARLAQVQLLQDLRNDPQALIAYSAIMTERAYPPGTTILEEGAIGAELYILVEGTVSVYKTPPEGETFRVAVLDASHFPTFGESGLIESEPRSATIRSDSAARCLVLERSAFDRFSAQNPHWALPVLRRVAQAVMGRFKKSNDDLLLLYKALMAEIRGT